MSTRKGNRNAPKKWGPEAIAEAQKDKKYTQYTLSVGNKEGIYNARKLSGLRGISKAQEAFTQAMNRLEEKPDGFFEAYAKKNNGAQFALDTTPVFLHMFPRIIIEANNAVEADEANLMEVRLFGPTAALGKILRDYFFMDARSRGIEASDDQNVILDAIIGLIHEYGYSQEDLDDNPNKTPEERQKALDFQQLIEAESKERTHNEGVRGNPDKELLIDLFGHAPRNADKGMGNKRGASKNASDAERFITNYRSFAKDFTERKQGMATKYKRIARDKANKLGFPTIDTKGKKLSDAFYRADELRLVSDNRGDLDEAIGWVRSAAVDDASIRSLLADFDKGGKRIVAAVSLPAGAVKAGAPSVRGGITRANPALRQARPPMAAAKTPARPTGRVGTTRVANPQAFENITSEGGPLSNVSAGGSPRGRSPVAGTSSRGASPTRASSRSPARTQSSVPTSPTASNTNVRRPAGATPKSSGQRTPAASPAKRATPTSAAKKAATPLRQVNLPQGIPDEEEAPLSNSEQ